MTEQKDKYALITGANGGVGQALCEAFTEEGYKVLATDLEKRPSASLSYDQYIPIDLNDFVVDEAYASEKIESVKLFLPKIRLNALINNAAVQILGGIDSLSRTDWNQTLNINLQAPFLLAQSFSKELENSNGSIVNISSIHSKLTKKNFVAYATSKAALSGMTQAMAADAEERFRVNAILPAAVATGMLEAGFIDEPHKYELLKSHHPMKRVGTPNEIAELAVFLSSRKASFIHGSCIDIAGGINALLHDPV